MVKQWGIPKEPEFLKPEEIRMFINACKRDRDRLVLETLWQTGGRLTEVLSLTPEQVGDNSIILKNLKQRKGKVDYKKVIVSEDLCVILKAYIKEQRILETTFIFSGNRDPNKQLDSLYVWRLITKIGAELGIRRWKSSRWKKGTKECECEGALEGCPICHGTGKVPGKGKPGFWPAWPHLFRHSCAMHILEMTGSTELTQKQLGHSSIITTQAYARVKELDAEKKLSGIDWK